MSLFVYLDTGIFKAARRQLEYGKRVDLSDDDGRLIGRRIPLVERSGIDRIKSTGAELKREYGLLPLIAEASKRGDLSLVTSHLALLEFMRLPRTFPGVGGMFFGEEYDLVPEPARIPYSLTAPLESYRSRLESISDARYLAIRKAVGAYQGREHVRLQQLVDAFLVWTAEAAGCRYFVTVDFKLADYRIGSDTLACVRPSVLLDALR